jgi:hypothetical protein
VALSSTPPGATVRLPDGTGRVTPCIAEVPWSPLQRTVVEVSAPGYRTLDVPTRQILHPAARLTDPFLRLRAVLAGDPREETHFDLVPVHGPVGTWDPLGEGLSE